MTIKIYLHYQDIEDFKNGDWVDFLVIRTDDDYAFVELQVDPRLVEFKQEDGKGPTLMRLDEDWVTLAMRYSKQQAFLDGVWDTRIYGPQGRSKVDLPSIRDLEEKYGLTEKLDGHSGLVCPADEGGLIIKPNSMHLKHRGHIGSDKAEVVAPLDKNEYASSKLHDGNADAFNYVRTPGGLGSGIIVKVKYPTEGCDKGDKEVIDEIIADVSRRLEAFNRSKHTHNSPGTQDPLAHLRSGSTRHHYDMMDKEDK